MTEFTHYTLIADGQVFEPNADYETEIGPLFHIQVREVSECRKAVTPRTRRRRHRVPDSRSRHSILFSNQHC